MKDNLTNLLTREELEKTIKSSRGQYLAEANIKSFMAINDCCGHEIGDEIIKIYADILVNEFGYNNVFRISGNSYAVVFDYRDIVKTVKNLSEYDLDSAINIYGRDNQKLNSFNKDWEKYKKNSYSDSGNLYLKRLSLAVEFDFRS